MRFNGYIEDAKKSWEIEYDEDWDDSWGIIDYSHRTFDSIFHEELSIVLMQVWDNRDFITNENMVELEKLFSIESNGYAEEDALWEWPTNYIEHRLNKVLYNIWDEQARNIPSTEIIEQLKKYR